MKKMLYLLLIAIGFATLVSCHGPMNMDNDILYFQIQGDFYFERGENSFLGVEEHPSSYFGLSSSTASYSNIRRMINNGVVNIPANAVKIEEMVNYFSYKYNKPIIDDLALSAEIYDSPWNANNKIVSIGIKTKEIDFSNKKTSNIVLLIDVSGSMAPNNKLPLLQESLKEFVATLDNQDTVSIVTYASGTNVVLEGAFGYEKAKINAVIEDLSASGSTHGSQGIQVAYELAKKYFVNDGHNRVIIGTDGDFNVGISSISGLEDFISEKRDEEKIYLSVLGFGYGNLRDDKLETLANAGNGTYAYIDTLTEAKKVLVEEMGGTLNIVAKDAKAKVEFNPEYVSSYRLLGYENRLFTEDSYNDAKTDSGEIGAGHTATAVYEIVLAETSSEEKSDKWLNVEVAYKDPESDEGKLAKLDVGLNNKLSSNEEDKVFIAAVIEFALILKGSQYKSDANLTNIINRIENLSSLNDDAYKREFLELVIKYQTNLNQK